MVEEIDGSRTKPMLKAEQGRVATQNREQDREKQKEETKDRTKTYFEAM